MVLKQEPSGLEKKFLDIALNVGNEIDLEVYDLVYISGSSTLRIFISRKDGNCTADINDCASFDRAMTPFLEEDWVPDDLILECSSPGMDRRLNSITHFKGAIGENIDLQIMGKLRTNEIEGLPKKLNGQNKFSANLLEVNETQIKVKIEDLELEFGFDKIKKARILPDYNFS